MTRADDVAPQTMKRVATALVVAMALLFVVTRWLESVHPWLGWIRAFAEAATVGALADWFAVTAIFRHPLGVPIPHTAIVPRNKERIGRNLGAFVERNFLASPVLREHVESVDFASALAQWLTSDGRARRLARRISAFVPGWLEHVDDAAVRARLQALVDARLSGVELGPIAGDALAALTAEGGQRAIVDRVVDTLAELLQGYEPAIRARIRERTSRLWRTLRVDEAVADRVISAAEEVIAEMSRDPEHPWRGRLDNLVSRLVDELRAGDKYREVLDLAKHRLIGHPGLREHVGGLWDEAKAMLRDDVTREDSLLARQIESAIEGFARTLDEDEATRERMNRWLRGAVVGVAEREGHRVSHLIAETIRRWDADTFTRRIESHVGNDLQFIRINGTVIGGAVGVLLHAVALAIG